MSNIEWPKSVPISPEIGTGNAFVNHSPCCIAGWASHVFAGDRIAQMHAEDEIRNLLGGVSMGYVFDWNDSVTPEERKRVWNQAMAKSVPRTTATPK